MSPERDAGWQKSVTGQSNRRISHISGDRTDATGLSSAGRGRAALRTLLKRSVAVTSRNGGVATHMLGSRSAALHVAVSSYAPTIRTLIHVQGRNEKLSGTCTIDPVSSSRLCRLP
nr:hypothetical protein CFP56_79631 [Quercus suber]